ncbi:hypothetical protein GCM10017600_32420 [Streptosporangium carneum]|uniref:Uncharacterized protein n=1 Tax=Streptosporangium carneum TaxID=47481 RepID=A0A9W6MD60_9ACTN|nr:hypothetical protein GCM10017600_32420 [Streptosporangium carneum]
MPEKVSEGVLPENVRVGAVPEKVSEGVLPENVRVGAVPENAGGGTVPEDVAEDALSNDQRAGNRRPSEAGASRVGRPFSPRGFFQLSPALLSARGLQLRRGALNRTTADCFSVSQDAGRSERERLRSAGRTAEQHGVEGGGWSGRRIKGPRPPAPARPEA